MLTEIGLKNFKCFKEETIIPVNRINLFTGINGRGKSTALQSLLLMRQSIEHNRTTKQIIFNGSCIELGRFNDIKNSFVSVKEPIKYIFKYRKESNFFALQYYLKENQDDDLVADISRIILERNFKNRYIQYSFIEKDNTFIMENKQDKYTFQNLLDLIPDTNTSPVDLLGIVSYLDHKRHNKEKKFQGKFEIVQTDLKRLSSSLVNIYKHIHYISADRIGPQDYYQKAPLTVFPNVGIKGEFTANILSKKKNEPVNDELCLPGGETKTVLDQTQAWLDIIFSGGKINIRSLEENIVIISMNSDTSKSFYKPINVGFGYSYALPIIVSGLIAKKGEILIVENPEAHLHPSAQSRLTKFLAKVSACCIQVFIESHSDHILNGLRIAVLDNIIKAEDTNIIYFHRDKDVKIETIHVTEEGKIENWPKGFFDQLDKDYERLFGI